MKWIGLTGGIASGKTTAAEHLRKLGLPVLDADQVAHEVIQSEIGLKSVVQAFGQEVLDSNQRIDRKKLGQKVFGQPAELEKLEKILHPLISSQVQSERKKLSQKGCPIAFYDVPLLFEKNMQEQFDFTVLIYAPRDLQIKRILSRNTWSREEIEKRLSHQMDIENKRKLADFVIDNQGDLEKLYKNLDQFLKLEAQVKS